jgi:hypothetical protein
MPNKNIPDSLQISHILLKHALEQIDFVRVTWDAEKSLGVESVVGLEEGNAVAHDARAG